MNSLKHNLIFYPIEGGYRDKADWEEIARSKRSDLFEFTGCELDTCTHKLKDNMKSIESPALEATYAAIPRPPVDLNHSTNPGKISEHYFGDTTFNSRCGNWSFLGFHSRGDLYFCMHLF